MSGNNITIRVSLKWVYFVNLICYFVFIGKEEEMGGRDLGRNRTLSNQNSTPECTVCNVHTLDFINLLQSISLKLSGELSWFYWKALVDER